MLWVIASESSRKILGARLKDAVCGLPGDEPPAGVSAAVVIRGEGVPPETVYDVVSATGAEIPIVVVAGRDDSVGRAFKKSAERMGLPEGCILSGEAVRLSHVLSAVDAAVKNGAIPDPPVSEDGLGEAAEYLDPKVCGEEPAWEEPARQPVPEPAWVGEEEPEWTASAAVLPVFGFKGGVGRTTVAAALGALYSTRGLNVAFVDAGVPAHLRYHLGDADAVTPYGKLIRAADGRGLARALSGAEADLAVVDLPPLPDYTEKLLSLCEKAVVVVVPDQLCFLETQKWWPRLREKSVLVVNQVPRTDHFRKSFAEVLKNELRGGLGTVEIPVTEEVTVALARKEPAVVGDVFGQAVSRVAALLGCD